MLLLSLLQYTLIACVTQGSELFSLAFTIPICRRSLNTQSLARGKASIFETRTPTNCRMVSDQIATSSNASKIVDKNGIEFTVGCTIQTSSEMRAYQVSRKGFGSFSESDKSFVPVDVKNMNSVPRFDRCFIMPEGLRAKVTKVYDLDEFDAILPIVAKFEAGESFQGEYSPPVTFLMHFDTFEIEVVE
mmetsp:Transcript_8767/g.11036  ORF Transcript_8767/g.11036 Transcript_8767/m.11036 type:complete len:189 (+) Transcript_8767:188-754(+)